MRVGKWQRPVGFTLVEMLVVISILLLVAVIALPAMGSLSKSSSRRAAVTQTMGILDQARAIALSQNTVVYVVFSTADSAIPEAYRFRSYAVFREVYYPEFRNLPPGKPEPYRLEIVRPWSKLPEGVAFKPVTTEKTVFSTDSPKYNFPFRMAEKGGVTTEQVIALPYLRFNATGLLEERPDLTTPRPANSARVRLFEGFVNEAGQPVVTNAAHGAADESVVLSTVTGRARREDAPREEANSAS